MQSEWDRFNAYLDKLSETQATTPTDAAGWTAKDHVMHLVVWEDGMNALLDGQSRPEYMGIDRATWTSGDFDRINAIIQQRHRDVPWAEVRQRFRDVHRRLVAKIEALAEADLQRPYNSFQPDSTATDPIINRLVGNTSHHFAEHQPWIETIVSL